MLNLTLHVPSNLVDATGRIVRAHPHTINVARFARACEKPDGDVITCMIPREAVSGLLGDLDAIEFDDGGGTITLDEHLTVLGSTAARAERDAAGAPDDALVWPALRASASSASELSITYLAFMVLATMLAAIGLLTASSVLIVGAMILGPEFGALAYLCVSALGRDLRGVRVALTQLVIGFGVAIAVVALATLLAEQIGLVTASQAARDFEHTIVSATWIGLVIACIAGIAGVLTLTSAKGDALIGVLVSVTTIPAAADMAIGLATSDSSRIADGAATLALNVTGMIIAGGATLALYRATYTRQRDRSPARWLRFERR